MSFADKVFDDDESDDAFIKSVEFGEAVTFMQFDSSSQSVSMDNEQAFTGNFTIKVVVEDSRGGEREYTFDLEVIDGESSSSSSSNEKDEPDESEGGSVDNVVEEEAGVADGEEASVADGEEAGNVGVEESSEDGKKDKKKQEPPKFFIKKVTSDGEVYISFN